MHKFGRVLQYRITNIERFVKERVVTVGEVELFKAVMKWVDSECAKQGINIEEAKTARRRVLGDSVYEIRFLEMSLEDFTKYVLLLEYLQRQRLFLFSRNLAD